MAVVGAAVLAFVSWACLREAQRIPTSSIRDGAAAAVDRPGQRATTAGAERTVPTPYAPARVCALGDATVPEADNDEALAAAAALWQVVMQTERV